MTTLQPVLILVDGERISGATMSALQASFATVLTTDAANLGAVEDAHPNAVVLRADATTAQAASPLLDALGDGIGIFSREGDDARLTFASARLEEASDEVRTLFTDSCRLALEQFERDGSALPSVGMSRRFNVAHDGSHYEIVVSASGVQDGRVTSVVGLLLEVTESRRLQSRIDAIDAAGAQLLQIDSASVAQLNLAERLRLLEDRITTSVRELLSFDNFEIRLIDRESNKLELVFLRGLKPLRIGEVLLAEEKNNGICGYVAATGRSYICDNVRHDAHYHDGMDDAASSLTVPLRLHDQVIGVFNIESLETNAFDETDCHLAELFGRYVALAMHILDLLVVERFTTNEQLTENVLAELGGPLGKIRRHATAARARTRSPQAMDDLDHILAAVGDIRGRLDTVITGPKSIVGAEPAGDDEDAPDPLLQGKRVLLVDNEPVVLDAICDFLTRNGCLVTTCGDGEQSIALLRTKPDPPRFDLVISDVHMGSRNGYEVFRAVKESDDATPVILMTGFGYDPHHSIVRANQEGLHSFLFKPLKAEVLLENVKAAISGETT